MRLTGTVQGMLIFMRWAAPHGGAWRLGKTASQITNSTPRLYKNFNYRTSWTDGWENHMLTLNKYDSGPDAPYESWVLLEKAAPVREEGVP